MPDPPPCSQRAPVSLAQDARRAVIGHFIEMPGLRLTAGEARRLCGLAHVDLASCQRLMDRLVDEGFLIQTVDGRYRKAAEGGS